MSRRELLQAYQRACSLIFTILLSYADEARRDGEFALPIGYYELYPSAWVTNWEEVYSPENRVLVDEADMRYQRILRDELRRAGVYLAAGDEGPILKRVKEG